MEKNEIYERERIYLESKAHSLRDEEREEKKNRMRERERGGEFPSEAEAGFLRVGRAVWEFMEI